ncbi:MAG: phage tail assembly protein [Achromobacter pestifer]
MTTKDQTQQPSVPSAQAQPDAAVAFSDGTTHVVILDNPIKRGDQDIFEITVRKPKAGALRGASLLNLVQLDVASLQTVLPRVTDPMMAPQEVANLDPSDLLALGAAVASFFMSKADRAAIQTA